MKKYLDVLKRCTLFEKVEEENLEAILGCLGARSVPYKKNETVIAEGSPAKAVGIVLRGEVQIVRNDYYGNRSIVANVEESQIFGESFACAGVESMPVEVVAVTDTEVMLIDCRKITNSCCNACSFHSQIIYNLMKVVAMKNLIFHQKIEITSKRTTREKLMTYLLAEAKKNGSRSFTIPYDRQELADYLEVDRSGLSAEISKMRREGIIETKKEYFKLKINKDFEDSIKKV